MKFAIKKLTIIGVLVSLSINNAVASDQLPENSSFACSDSEVKALMDKYQEKLGTVDSYNSGNYREFQDIRLAHLANNSGSDNDNLCAILMNSDFDIPQIDLSKLKAAWASLKAIMTVKSYGIDWSAVMTTAYNKALQSAKKWLSEKTCKLAQDFSSSVNSTIDDTWDETKEWAEEEALDNDIANDLGVSSLDPSDLPIYKQIAEKQTEEQLGEYADYAKWYESDRWESSNGSLQESVDDIIDKVIGDKTDEFIDKNIEDVGSDRLDEVVDKFKPNY